MSLLLIILAIDAALVAFVVTYLGAGWLDARRTSRRRGISKAAD